MKILLNLILINYFIFKIVILDNILYKYLLNIKNLDL